MSILYRIIPLRMLRRTPGVHFDEMVPSDIPKISGIDRVIHGPNSISPGPIEDSPIPVKRPWYMHPGQDDNLLVLQGTRYIDIFDPKTEEKISRFFPRKLDVIISDMAADTTGSKSLDSIRTNQLCSKVLELSSNLLKSDGVVVSKLFMGEDFIEVKNLAKSVFQKVNFFKPKSSRKESKETYLHCEILKTL